MRVGIVVLIGWIVGCGSSGPTRSENEIASAQTTLTDALNAWQKNEPIAKTPNFSEEWRKTHSLTEYTIGTSSVPDTRTIAFVTTLKLKDKKGNAETREVTYLVMLGTPNRVTRDPYN